MKQIELQSERPLYFAQYSIVVKKELYERKYKVIKVLSGKAVISNSTERIVIGRDRYAFVGPGCFSKIEMVPAANAPFSIVCLNFDDRIINDYAKHNSVQSCKEPVSYNLRMLDNSEWIDALFGSLSLYIAGGELPDDFLVKVKLIECLHIINRKYPEVMAGMLGRGKLRKISLQTFMNDNYMYNAPLVRFAELSGRSLSSFRRDFMATFKTTPNRWIMEKRLSVAYDMLKNGGKRSSEIYWEVGFETLAHFSRKFKERYGVPPTRINAVKEDI